jgi:hypothetical protein
MKPWSILALCGLLVIATTTVRADDMRFSHRLTALEQSQAGLQKLSPDQLAVLDALFRRDGIVYAQPDPAHPAPARFSQRLSAGERQSAGLDLLSAGELARLDALVDHYESGGLPPLTAASTTSAFEPELKGPAPEVHGMISFTYGTGRGGYSMTGGAMALSVDDPAHGMSLLVSYAEMHGRGSYSGWGCGRMFPSIYPPDFLPPPIP